ncbi:hypothetical protein [Sporosarcina sp. Te-1]|uniref:hypothetical protein n=1 Tax=Sporosarcina sp. Te-1 TaxID=2818390 RepID=UPI001A9E7816|nr:hypothetical protein [Sporosarcina sp. Te-1]QTD39490.1 hypothetical protein J3U78_11470 [Sporosarcina sp. Te-1]
MKPTITIPITPIANLEEELEHAMLVSIAIGHHDDVFVLLAEEQPPLINGCFPATVTEKSYGYQVIHIKDGLKTVLLLPEEKWNYHFVQPIDEDHILLVCARSYYHDAQNIEKNARVYDKNGRFIRSFCLGDGIERVYVTKDQEIWTGYFDEGVYGNYGWEVPIGSSGLVGWDAFGRKIDSLEEEQEYHIFECLGLNGAPDGGIWFYFSIESKIGVRKDGKTSYYSPEDNMFRTFAMNGETVTVHRGQETRTLSEMRREGDQYKTIRDILLMKPNGVPLISQMVNTRENTLLFLDGNELYLYEMKL